MPWLNSPICAATPRARKHKSAVEKWIADELASTGILSPGERAREVMLLTEGAMALMLIHGDPGWANSAAQAAKRLLQTRQALASHGR